MEQEYINTPDQTTRRSMLRRMPRSVQNTASPGSYRSYLGLTQSCRQIRAEYQPLHRAHVRISIPLKDLDAFILDHYPDGDDTAYACASKNLEILVHREGAENGPFNLLHVVRVERSAPNLRFIFKANPYYVDKLIKILDKHREPQEQWLEFLDRFHKAQMYVPAYMHSRGSITFTMSPWTKRTCAFERFSTKTAGRILSDAGLPDLHNWDVSIS